MSVAVLRITALSRRRLRVLVGRPRSDGIHLDPPPPKVACSRCTNGAGRRASIEIARMHIAKDATHEAQHHRGFTLAPSGSSSPVLRAIPSSTPISSAMSATKAAPGRSLATARRLLLRRTKLGPQWVALKSLHATFWGFSGVVNELPGPVIRSFQ